MKIKELIAELQQYDEEAIVEVRDKDIGFNYDIKEFYYVDDSITEDNYVFRKLLIIITDLDEPNP